MIGEVVTNLQTPCKWGTGRNLRGNFWKCLRECWGIFCGVIFGNALGSVGGVGECALEPLVMRREGEKLSACPKVKSFQLVLR